MTRPVRYGQCPFANDPPFLVARSVLRGSAHGSISSSLAISFTSRVVQNHAQWQIAPASKRFAKASVESWREIKRDVHEGAVLLEVSFREANRELRVPRIYEPLE